MTGSRALSTPRKQRGFSECPMTIGLSFSPVADHTRSTVSRSLDVFIPLRGSSFSTIERDSSALQYSQVSYALFMFLSSYPSLMDGRRRDQSAIIGFHSLLTDNKTSTIKRLMTVTRPVEWRTKFRLVHALSLAKNTNRLVPALSLAKTQIDWYTPPSLANNLIKTLCSPHRPYHATCIHITIINHDNDSNENNKYIRDIGYDVDLCSFADSTINLHYLLHI